MASVLQVHNVFCCVPAWKRSRTEAVAFILSLRSVFPKALLRWMANTYIVQEKPTEMTLHVLDWGRPSIACQTFPQERVVDFVVRMKKVGVCAIMYPDSLLVHCSPREAPKLLFIGLRMHQCAVRQETMYQGWRGPPLTPEELDWLGQRTLEEAGVCDGDKIDLRYRCIIELLMDRAPLAD